MKMIYQKPVVERLIKNEDLHFTAFAQSAVINLCQGAGGGSLELIGGQIEFCDDGAPSPGAAVVFTCAEDGNHTLIVNAVSSGSISCPVGDSPFILSVSVTPDFPPICTVTGLSVDGQGNQCLAITNGIGN
jgi:hypothetical protein